MTRRTYYLLLAFALLALGASSASAWVHYQLLNDPKYTSFCDINATLSCTEAYLSSYGSLFGTPVALLGMLWGAAVVGLLLAGRAETSSVRENLAGYVFAMSTVGLAMVLYLAYTAFFVLRAICPLCFGTYVAVVGLFVVSGSQMTFPMTSLPQRLLRDLRSAASSPVAIAAIAIFLVGAASAIAFFPKEAPEGEQTAALRDISADQRAQVEGWFESQPRNIVPVGETNGAAVVVVKFNDYQCPPCKQTYLNYKPIFQKWQAQAPGKVLFVIKDFPLDPECNVNTPGGPHPLACEAAASVRQIRSRKESEALEDWIFGHQSTLTMDSLKQAARDIGGIKDWDAQYPKMLDQIKTDIALGKLLGVSATPTFFINGVRVSGGMAPEFFDAIIAHEVKKNQATASQAK
jgi:protein-disulfide isomerase/uncharacterized membrane protein